MQRTLATVYLDAVERLPDSLRVRRPLIEKVATELSRDKNICIRGFWRIGKTEMIKAILRRAVETRKVTGLFFDLRTDEEITTKEKILKRIYTEISEFYRRLGTNVLVDQKEPLKALEKAGQNIFLGIDELVILSDLDPKDRLDILKQIRDLPPNVKVVLVCHRHRLMDETFEKEIVGCPNFSSFFVPPITDKELGHIVRAPATLFNIDISNDAVLKIGEFAGNRPWEVFLFCHIISRMMEEKYPRVRIIESALVEEALSFEEVLRNQATVKVVDNYLRVLNDAMSSKERKIIMEIAGGHNSELNLDQSLFTRLEQTGWIKKNEVWQINGLIFEELVKGVLSGRIRVEE